MNLFLLSCVNRIYFNIEKYFSLYEITAFLRNHMILQMHDSINLILDFLFSQEDPHHFPDLWDKRFLDF